MTPPVVVHIDDPGGFDVYVGRELDGVRAAPGFGLQRRRAVVGLDAALSLFEADWRKRLAGPARRMWLKRLRALDGVRLGCACPAAGGRSATRRGLCHAEVLVKLWVEWFGTVGQRSQWARRRDAIELQTREGAESQRRP